ncbi:MAG: phosphatase PAP2 family protein, partial [Deltaproteobacteria bacterium]
ALLVALAVAVAGADRRRDLTPRWDRAAFLGFVLLGALPVAYVIATPLARLDRFGVGWLEAHVNWVAALSIGVSLAFQLAFERARPTVPAPARRWAWLTIWLALVVVVVVTGVLKVTWGRVRFSELDAAATAFTPWFMPQGATGHVSFPSGHTAWAWMALPLLALVADRARRTRAWVAAAVVAYGLAVAVGRVRYGAHYASDVTFSTGVAVFALAVIDRSLRRRAQSPRAKPTSAATSEARSASASTSSSGKPTTTD